MSIYNPYKIIINAYINNKQHFNKSLTGSNDNDNDNDSNNNSNNDCDYFVNLFLLLPNITKDATIKAYALLAHLYYMKDNVYELRCLHMKLQHKFTNENANIELMKIHYKYIQCLHKHKFYSCALKECTQLLTQINTVNTNNTIYNELQKELTTLTTVITNDYNMYNKTVKDKITKLHQSGFIKRLFDKHSNNEHLPSTNANTSNSNSNNDKKQLYVINKQWYEHTKSLLLNLNNVDISSLQFSEIDNLTLLSHKPTLINPLTKVSNAKHLLYNTNITTTYTIVNSFTYSYLKYIFTSTNDISISNTAIPKSLTPHKLYIRLLLLNTELKSQSKFNIKPTYMCFDITLTLQSFISKLIHKHLKGNTNYFVFSYKLLPHVNAVKKKQILFDIIYAYTTEHIEHYYMCNRNYMNKVSNNMLLENKGWYVIEICSGGNNDSNSGNSMKEPFIKMDNTTTCKECVRDVDTYDKYTTDMLKNDMHFNSGSVCSFHNEMHLWMNREVFMKNLIEVQPTIMCVGSKYNIINDKCVDKCYSNIIRLIIQCDLLAKYFILRRDERERSFTAEKNVMEFIECYRTIVTQLYTNNTNNSSNNDQTLLQTADTTCVSVDISNVSNSLSMIFNNKKQNIISICDLINTLFTFLSKTLNYVRYYPLIKHKKPLSIIQDIFSFQLSTQVHCTTCSTQISNHFFSGSILNLSLPSNKKQIRLKLKIFPCESYNYAETDFLLDKSDYIVIKQIKAQIKGTDAYELLLFNPSQSKLTKLTDDDILYIGTDQYCKCIDLSKEEILIYCTSPEHPVEAYAYFYILPFVFVNVNTNANANEDEEPLEQIVFYPALFHAGRTQQVKALAEKISVFYMSRVQEIYIKHYKTHSHTQAHTQTHTQQQQQQPEEPLTNDNDNNSELNDSQQNVDDEKPMPNFSKQTIEEFVNDTMDNNINLVFYALHESENIQAFAHFKVQSHASIQNEYQHNAIHLNDLITYSNNESLQMKEVECVKCKKNKTSFTINYQTQLVVMKEPLYLLINIKRFYVNKISLEIEKNEIDVQYEEEFKFGRRRYTLKGVIVHDGDYVNGRYKSVYQICNSNNNNKVTWVNGDNNSEVHGTVCAQNVVALLYKQSKDKKKK